MSPYRAPYAPRPGPAAAGCGRNHFRRKVARSRRGPRPPPARPVGHRGVGNVYRAEILWRLRLDPWRPGNDLTSEVIEALWRSGRAARTRAGAGWIVTDDAQARAARALLVRGERAALAQGLCRVWPRRQTLRLCGTSVRAAAMGQQRIFWCPTCRPRHQQERGLSNPQQTVDQCGRRKAQRSERRSTGLPLAGGLYRADDRPSAAP